MSKRVLVVTFAAEDTLLQAARAARTAGLKIRDAYTPYAVHGLDEALGWRPSRLTWACGLLGFAGVAIMTWFQFWTSAVDWPINVGGKPWNSLPAFVPVIFESLVLPAGVGTVLVFLAISKLYPGRRPAMTIDRVTDDRFALLLEETTASFEWQQAAALFAQYQALAMEERVLADPPSRPAGVVETDRRGLGRINALLGALLALMVLVLALAQRNTEQPNLEFLPDMVHSPAYDAYQLRSVSPLKAEPGRALLPPLGTVARGEVPLHYQATEADGAAAGRELVNPLAADDAGAKPRGEYIFRNFCAACHGPAGQGDGPVAQRGYPPPPAFAAGKSRDMKDGELFHIISYGRNNMPAHRGQLEPRDRWCVIRYLRGFQTSAPSPTAPAK